MIIRVATAAGAYLRRTAAAMCSSMMRKTRAVQKRQRLIDGFLITASRQGGKARARILDLPGFLAVLGDSQSSVWPYSILPPRQTSLCPPMPMNRGMFLQPGFANNIWPVVDGEGTAILGLTAYIGPTPRGVLLGMNYSARPAEGVGACVAGAFIQVQSGVADQFAYGLGSVWLLVSYAQPTQLRAWYEADQASAAGSVQGAIALGVTIDVSTFLQALGAVAHPPRPSAGWGAGNTVVNTIAPVAWTFSFPYPSQGRHPNIWVSMQVTIQRSNSDYVGRRCLLLVRITDIDEDAMTYALRPWLIDPEAAYPGRSTDGSTSNYHCPSAPLALSDGSCVIFDPYFADTPISAGGATRNYTLSLVRVIENSASTHVLHTSDIALTVGGTTALLDPDTLAQYHFEGADVSDDDVVVGVVFGYEFAASKTATIYKLENVGVTSQTFPTEDFTRCLFGKMAAQTGLQADFEGHWGVRVSNPDIPMDQWGLHTGADKVTYIGNHKWAVYVSSQVFAESALDVAGDWAVAIYDAQANTFQLAGIIAPYDGSYGACSRLGRMDCVVQEAADDQGGIVRKATIIATFGTGTWFAGNTGGIRAGRTYISYDSGESWRQLLECGSPAGVVYCGNIIQPRTTPIARGL